MHNCYKLIDIILNKYPINSIHILRTFPYSMGHHRFISMINKLLLICLTLLSFTYSPASEQVQTGFAGYWNTSYGPMEIIAHEDNHYTGWYDSDYYQGTLSGTG